MGLIRRSVTQDFLIIANSGRARTPYLDGNTIKGRDENNGVLIGEVVVLPPDSDPQAKQTLSSLLATIHEEMDSRHHEFLINPPGQLDELPAIIRSMIDAARTQIVCYKLRFALFRTGEIRIWFDWADFLGRDVTQFPPDILEELVGEALPSQAYYFLKDVFHFHYHHDPRTDQLLDLTRLDTSSCVALQDIEWRINILRGLAKVVVEYRQSNRPDSNKKALGVLAYADAFQSLLAKIKRPPALETPFQLVDDIILYDFGHSRVSIEALDALTESERSGALQLFGIFIGVVLSAFALWAGAVQIQPILCGDARAKAAICPPISPGITTDFVNRVVANPLGFVVFLTMLGFIAYIFLFKRVTNVPGAKPVLRFVKSLSAAIGTEIAKRSSADRAGYYAQLVVLAGMTGSAAWVAYEITPKNDVPPVIPRPSVASPGPWAALDTMVGRLPKDSGLFTSSAIARKIQDTLGPDYESFLRNMAYQSPLRRNRATMWVVGSAAANSADTAYLLIDQNTQQIEIGVSKGGRANVYRSTGAPLKRPAEVQRALGGLVADVGPFPLETSLCKTGIGGSRGVIQLSGALRGIETCQFRIDLRKGQLVSYRPASAKGLDISLGTSSSETPLSNERLIEADGTYRVRVAWQRTGGRYDLTRPRREFYVRLNVR